MPALHAAFSGSLLASDNYVACSQHDPYAFEAFCVGSCQLSRAHNPQLAVCYIHRHVFLMQEYI